MGCDIHMYAEIKKKYKNPDVKPEWRLAGRIFKDAYYRGDDTSTLSVFENGDDWESNSQLTEHPYQGRNYDLFAILADVRNGSGFDGVDTGDGFNPIFDPRGLPEDVSKDYKQLVDNYGVDGHSHSWVTLDELDSYDWNQVTKHRGYVSPLEYKVFKEKGHPNSWSGGVSGGKVEHISNELMDRVLERKEYMKELETKGYVEKGKHYYTQVEWQETYRDSVGDTFFKSVESVRDLLKRPDVLDVRLVFFFDN